MGAAAAQANGVRSRPAQRSKRSPSSTSDETLVPEAVSGNAQDALQASRAAHSHLRRLLTRVARLPYDAGLFVAFVLYAAYQLAVRALFAPGKHPRSKKSRSNKPRGRVAIVGAGLTGISSAAHCVAHGFDVVIYESDEQVGGVWARVNSTSSLQLNSILYRFHPRVFWRHGFPKRDEILGEIERLVSDYDLQDCIRFQTPVKKVSRHEKLSTDPKQGGHARWLVNAGEDGVFDGIIASVGTCGKPKMTEMDGMDSFTGKIVHSSELDDVELAGKRVVIVGSGASGVEAAELAVNKNAKHATVLARSDKWIIPRNTLFDIMLALQPFGREMPLSFIPEWLIRLFHYRDLRHLAPAKKGLFEATPIVNNDFLAHVRAGAISYRRASTKRIESHGVRVDGHDAMGEPVKGEQDDFVRADVIVLATGFERPSIDFLPDDLFPVEDDMDYRRPNLYIQNVPVTDCSVLLTNSAYMDAIGTVGNWHIGILTRIMLVFLMDESTRPSPRGMKLWVMGVNWLKLNSWGGDKSGLAFFSYSELVFYMLSFHLFRPMRLRWFPFVCFGWGVSA